MIEEFKKYGRLLFESGVISSHGGNMSIKLKEGIAITRRNSMLGNLTDGDIVIVEADGTGSEAASRELPVHLSIYNKIDCGAVVHAHPPYAVALSLIMDRIVPVDAEGSYYLKEVPVLSVENSIGSEEVAEKIPKLLKQCPIVMVKGHGSFAVGRDLEEGFRLTSSLEFSSRILWLCRNFRGDIGDFE
ncbi:MAG: Class II aldolase/adducin family protein [Clostridia bacterium 41_269]|nr:MAG: Class II aldolase/adducin family protein [Clostridia bacterium 41_269]